MKLLHISRVHLAIAVVGVAAAGGGAIACSSDNTGTTTPPAAPKTCANSQLAVAFSPMYSAFDGTHTFQVPVVVDGVVPSTVSWNISDDSIATIAKDPATGGIMLTIQKAGTANVIASTGSRCGSALLTVSAATAEDWEVGNQRYNNGVVLRPKPKDGGAEAGADAGSGPTQQAACTNCHGPTATSAFKDIGHTPQQTAGFSDDELQGIFRNGVVPEGGYFDPAIVPYDTWQGFHKWDMTDEQAKGIVVYLRALTPEQQEGAANFGRRDGG